MMVDPLLKAFTLFSKHFISKCDWNKIKNTRDNERHSRKNKSYWSFSWHIFRNTKKNQDLFRIT